MTSVLVYHLTYQLSTVRTQILKTIIRQCAIFSFTTEDKWCIYFKGALSQKRMQKFVLAKFEKSMFFQDPNLNEIACMDPY